VERLIKSFGYAKKVTARAAASGETHSTIQQLIYIEYQQLLLAFSSLADGKHIVAIVGHSIRFGRRFVASQRLLWLEPPSFRQPHQKGPLF
jgi:hypothetical protein